MQAFLKFLAYSIANTFYRMGRAPVVLLISLIATIALAFTAVGLGIKRFGMLLKEAFNEDRAPLPPFIDTLPPFLTNRILGVIQFDGADDGFTRIKKVALAHFEELGWLMILGASIASGAAFYVAVFSPTALVFVPFVPALAQLATTFAAAMGEAAAISISVLLSTLAVSLGISAFGMLVDSLSLTPEKKKPVHPTAEASGNASTEIDLSFTAQFKEKADTLKTGLKEMHHHDIQCIKSGNTAYRI